MSIKSILVGLDLSEMDDAVIRYSSLIADIFQSRNVYFIHIAKDLELPDQIIKEYSEVLTNIDEGIEHNIQEKIKTGFNAKSETTIEVQEGNAVEKMLRYAKIKNVDLIILGKKKRLKGTGVIPKSIARKAPCSLLLTPETTRDYMPKNILVPVDFSRHSLLATEHALEFVKKYKAKITCINIYEVPTGYTKTGKTYNEFADIMRRHAITNFEKFSSSLDIKPDFDTILSKDHDYEDELVIYIEATKPDLVIVGSKGRTDAAIVLLGSMAEKLTSAIEAPLFVVKRKGETLNIFEALLRI